MIDLNLDEILKTGDAECRKTKDDRLTIVIDDDHFFEALGDTVQEIYLGTVCLFDVGNETWQVKKTGPYHIYVYPIENAVFGLKIGDKLKWQAAHGIVKLWIL